MDLTQYGMLPTVEERLTSLEEKLDRLLAHLEPKKRDEISVAAPETFILTVDNRHSAEADKFGAWIYWLNKLVIVKPSGSQDVGPSAREAIGKVGTVKGLLISTSRYGQSADAAVEFPYDVVGGHNCSELCRPKQGLWFGTNNIEIT